MGSRDTSEEHRASTPLELLYDLCFVVAIARAATLLHHDVSHGAAGYAVVSYVLVFFAIWWAWMNFSWFASAFDTDDWLYRVTTIVQMGGVLVPPRSDHAGTSSSTTPMTKNAHTGQPMSATPTHPTIATDTPAAYRRAVVRRSGSWWAARSHSVASAARMTR